MKKIALIVFAIGLLFFGCVQTIQLPSNQTIPQTEEPMCHIVTEQIPYIEEVCGEKTTTKEICSQKHLEYTAGRLEETDLCISTGDCMGKPLGGCISKCATASKRCRMSITNNDPEDWGTWVMGATFHQGTNASFVKEPQSAEIMPNETYTFDFTQIYGLSIPPTMATCSLYLLVNGTAEDCRLIGTTAIVCENVTKMRQEQKVVCE